MAKKPLTLEGARKVIGKQLTYQERLKRLITAGILSGAVVGFIGGVVVGIII